MNKITNILKSYAGQIVISIILGLGISSMFRKSCNGENCRVFKAPHSKNIKGKIFKKDDRCYSVKEKNVTCDSNKRIIEYFK